MRSSSLIFHITVDQFSCVCNAVTAISVSASYHYLLYIVTNRLKSTVTMRKKTQPKSSADGTESESNSSNTMPTTSRHNFDASDSDVDREMTEAEISDDNNSEDYEPSKKRKTIVQKRTRNSSEEVDSDGSDHKCVLISKLIFIAY